MTETPTKTVDENGDVIYIDSAGEYHREDGPAKEWADGGKEWYLHGKWHREDGPAIIYPNGTKEWFVHGEYHREDGPAVEHADDYKSWYLHGVKVDGKTYEHVLTCPLEELPEYLETEYECVAAKRLGK